MESWCQTMSGHLWKWSDTLSDHLSLGFAKSQDQVCNLNIEVYIWDFQITLYNNLNFNMCATYTAMCQEGCTYASNSEEHLTTTVYCINHYSIRQVFCVTDNPCTLQCISVL